MTGHWIRLRGGWEWQTATTEEALPKRLTLPLEWPTDLSQSVRLLRSFQCPSFDPITESLSLRLDEVSGLLAVWLNDRELARPAGQCVTLVLPLADALPRRNLLVLEVQPPRRDSEAAPVPWGVIALVIQPRAPGGSYADVLGEPDGVA